MQDILKPIEELFLFVFSIVEGLENFPNRIAIVTIMAGLAIWFFMQYKYNKIADANPDQLK